MGGTLHLVIPQPTGSCSGVINSLDLLKRAREAFPLARIFANHQPVHHRQADRVLQENNIRVLEPGSGLMPGDLVVGSAHGTPLEEIRAVTKQGARFVDGVCPLVEGNFGWIGSDKHNITIYVGKPGHREFEATSCRARSRNIFLVDLHQENVDTVIQAVRGMALRLPIVLLRQTTIPANDPHYVRIQQLLKQGLAEYEFVRNHGECFATQNRQESLARGIEIFHPEFVLVLTAENSSNGMALVRTSQAKAISLIKAEGARELVQLAVQAGVLDTSPCIMLVAAASVIEEVIEQAVEELATAASRNGRQCEIERPWLVSRNSEPALKKPQLAT